jgi:uncharacterized protein (DUF885 family)
MIGRRAFLGVVVGVAAAPRIAFAASDNALDKAAAASPEERVRLLRAIDTAALPESSRTDVEGALAGAEAEAAIARDFPFTGPMGSLFAVSPAHGSWRPDGKLAGAALAKALDEETDRVRMGASRGVALPSSLFADFLRDFDKAAAQVGDQAVAAALGRQRAALVAAHDAVPAGDGLGRAAHGDALYAALLRLQAGEAIDPKRFDARMAELCRSLTARADTLLRAQGLDKGPVGERLRAFARDPRFLYSDDDAGRDRAVADMNRWLDTARATLPAAFTIIPAAAGVVRASRMSAADEAASRQGYRIVPDAANGMTGAYYVDLAHIRLRPSWSLRSVVHHELLPGHMMQLPLQADAHPHPLRLRYAPGFVEGWAVYAEQLATETGLFADDPQGEIGYLQWMLFRAGRGLSDSGVHLHGWTVAEAAARRAALQGDPAVYAPFAKDAASVALGPAGQAGQAWNWQALAELAGAAGPVGSAARRRCHDGILRHGAMPIATLRKNNRS